MSTMDANAAATALPTGAEDFPTMVREGERKKLLDNLTPHERMRALRLKESGAL